MKIYVCLICLFFVGCQSFSEPVSVPLSQQYTPPIEIPHFSELESIDLYVCNLHMPIVGFAKDEYHNMCIELHISNSEKIEQLVAIFHEMNPKITPWPLGYLSCPPFSALKLKRKKTALIPNEIATFCLTDTGDSFGAFVRLTSDMKFKGMEQLEGGYLVNISPKGAMKLKAFLSKEIRDNLNDPNICKFVHH